MINSILVPFLLVLRRFPLVCRTVRGSTGRFEISGAEDNDSVADEVEKINNRSLSKEKKRTKTYR